MALFKNRRFCGTLVCIIIWGEIFAIAKIISRYDLLPQMRNKLNKYILIWTPQNSVPIKYLGKGQECFLQKNCAQKNCYVTYNRTFFHSVSIFDMILIHGPEFFYHNMTFPKSRSPHQIYVFASIESPTYYPSCTPKLNGVFNWTWTHKLKSDLAYLYMIIKDKKGNVIGPNKDIHWEKVENMQPIDNAIKAKLDRKTKAAAWFVSNCGARNNRRQVAAVIKDELEKYGFTLDVFGRCGRMSCELNAMEDCSKLIENHYYFYLSFENSFSEDYVTEKLLRALNSYAVPVVYGGANYTRFMPDGIYLNARSLELEDLVGQMVYLINNKEQYYNYFRWHNHYSYHEPTEFPETDPYCNLCAAINNQKILRRAADYEHFDKWWNDPYACPKIEFLGFSPITLYG